MSNILITGATGHLGTAVIDYLLKSNPLDKVVGLVRSTEKAAYLTERGIETRVGDYDDRDSLVNALQGIDKVLLISGTAPHRLQQHKAVVDASKQAGVQHIIYTGVSMKDVSTSLNNPLMEDHFKTEDYIKENGFTFTFLRNSLYSDSIPGLTGEAAVETGIFIPAKNGKVSYVLRDELAEVTANVLWQNGHENKIYELTGGPLYSFGDIAAILSELSGKTVPYSDIDEPAYAEMLRKYGVPEMLITIVSGYLADIRNGQFEIESNDLETLLGRKPVNLSTVLKDVYHL